MMKHITCAMAVAVLLAAPVASAAQTAATPQSPAAGRRAAMGQRLRDGVRSGQLTRGELRRVRTRLAAIRAHATQLRAGGLSRAERATLRREWHRASRLVFGLKHNQVRRGGR